MSVTNKEMTDPKLMKSTKGIEEVIAQAIKKARVSKENELCKYIPMKTGGYIHHFTFKKMKTKQPAELAALIEQHILNHSPTVIAPKQRAARGSRKRREQMNFTRGQLERMLSIARLAGDKEIVTILSPRKSVPSCKKALIQSIRHNEIEPNLWNDYVEAMQAWRAIQADPSLILQSHN